MKFITFNVLNEKYTGWHYMEEDEYCTGERLNRKLENNNSTNRRMEMIIKIINEHTFDIIFLQEVGKKLHYMLTKLKNKYFISNMYNNSEQVTMLNKNKFHNMLIHYQFLKRIDTSIGITHDGKEILFLNGHLPWGEKREPYVDYINKTIKKHETFVCGGDMNVSNKKNLVPSARSLVKNFDDAKYSTSYSRGDCVNNIYRYKIGDRRYEFVDHIYVSSNIKSSDVKIYTSYDKKLSDYILFKDIRAPYHVNDWPSDHAMLFTEIIFNDSHVKNDSYKYSKYKKKYNQLKEIYSLSL